MSAEAAEFSKST